MVAGSLDELSSERGQVERPRDMRAEKAARGALDSRWALAAAQFEQSLQEPGSRAYPLMAQEHGQVVCSAGRARYASAPSPTHSPTIGSGPAPGADAGRGTPQVTVLIDGRAGTLAARGSPLPRGK